MRKNLEDSEMLTESLMQNENDDGEDDELVATISPLDMKMKKLLMLKKDKENQKKGEEQVGYVNADNDDQEFDSAEDEVLEDLEEHEKTQMVKPDSSAFMVDFLKANQKPGQDLSKSRTKSLYNRLHQKQQ